METLTLDPRLQRQVELGSSGLDIIHGELKNFMLQAEVHLEAAREVEEESGSAIDSMERTYWEGQLDALSDIYSLTYVLAFEIQERDSREV